jgi:hypothetical protein
MENLVGDIEGPFIAKPEGVGEDEFESGRRKEDGDGVGIDTIDEGKDTDPRVVEG